MVRWSRISSILLVAVTLAAILLPGTATARYVVEPVTEEYTGEMHDLEEITFWDLPPRVMLLYFLLTLLPGLPYVGELFYALSILLPLGFRRVRRHNVLDDDFRRDLYRQITIHPGASTRELRKLTGASRGRLRYHLDMLIREGKVAAVDYRNRFRYFARNQRYTASRSASSPASGTRPRGRYWYTFSGRRAQPGTRSQKTSGSPVRRFLSTCSGSRPKELSSSTGRREPSATVSTEIPGRSSTSTRTAPSPGTPVRRVIPAHGVTRSRLVRPPTMGCLPSLIRCLPDSRPVTVTFSGIRPDPQA